MKEEYETSNGAVAGIVATFDEYGSKKLDNKKQSLSKRSNQVLKSWGSDEVAVEVEHTGTAQRQKRENDESSGK